MIDIETMGNKSFSAIVSIAAVEFDINTGETGAEFYTKVDLNSCVERGLKMQADTVLWWMGQSDEARKEITAESSPHLDKALSNFYDFVSKKEYYIWGNSARFDLGILENAFNSVGMPIPWDY
jgi:DNA polymerase III epsilon subunit-like protein